MSSLTQNFTNHADPVLVSCSIGVDLQGAFYTANYGGDKLEATQPASDITLGIPTAFA